MAVPTRASIDLDAPIVPGEGLGGLHVRTPIAHLQRLLADHLIAVDGKVDWFGMANLNEARYRLGAVEIAVDVRNGKVFKLTALAGYRGRLFDKLSIDLAVARAMELDARLYYDEVEEMLLVKGCDGVTLDLPVVDPDPASVPTLHIHAISVIAPEAFSVEGMKGHW